MHIIPVAGPGQQGIRRGVATIGLLLFFAIVVVVLIAVFAFAMLGRHHRAELRNAVDAAALAGAAALADDVALTAQPDARDQVVRTVRRAALALGVRNRVKGQPLELDRNDDNAIDGDLVLGGLDGAFSREFRVNGRGPLDVYHPDLNAVRVAVRNGPAAASATALADHDVLGFRATPPPSPPSEPPLPSPPEPPLLRGLPLVPLAVLSDPPAPKDNTPDQWVLRAKDSWEYRIMARGGPGGMRDDWRYDSVARGPVAGTDGIPEILVRISARDGDGGNGLVLRLADPARPSAIPDENRRELVRQVETGVGYDDLRSRESQPLGGQLLLWDRSRQAPEELNQVRLLEWAQDNDGRKALAASLRLILGEPRVWVLYSSIWKDDQHRRRWAGAVGFVAARVMSVDGEDSGVISVVLQPTVLNVAGAVTDTSRRDVGPRGLYTPTIARVRVVE